MLQILYFYINLRLGTRLITTKIGYSSFLNGLVLKHKVFLRFTIKIAFCNSFSGIKNGKPNIDLDYSKSILSKMFFFITITVAIIIIATVICGVLLLSTRAKHWVRCFINHHNVVHYAQTNSESLTSSRLYN